MGYKAADVAARVVAGSPSAKAVLNAMARRACDACGLTWAGVGAIASDTELGKTTIRDNLSRLTRDGLLVVARFPQGGRGLSTEYIVLPGLMKLSPAPCGRCASEMKKAPPAGAFARMSSGKAPGGGGFSSVSDPKGTGSHPEKAPPAGDHQSENKHQSGTESETSLPLGLTFDHPSDDPMGRQAAKDALRAVEAMFGPETRRKP